MREPDPSEIVMVCGSMPPDRCGVGAYTARLASELASHREIWCIQPTGTQHVEGTRVVEVDAWNLRSLFRLARLCRTRRPRGVILQYPSVRYRSSLAVHLFVPTLRLMGTRVLVVLHEHAASPRIGRLRNLAVVAFARNVFVSNGLDRRALPRWIRRKTALVPIGSNIPVIDRRMSVSPSVQRGASAERRATVGFFGHPFRSKRIEVFLEMVNDEGCDYDFEVISMFDHDDDYQEDVFQQLQDIVRQHPTRLRVVEDASNSEVSLLLADLDYLVLPEQHPLTGKSGSSLAGITHSVVVIGCAAADPADNLPYVDGVNCVLLPTMDSTAIIASLERLESDPAKREQILLGARSLAADTSWNGIAQRYEACIGSESPARYVP